MGWYGYLPTMECFHGILSMDHKLKGALSIDDKKISFNNGRGYIEKDWGRNFPQNWFWTQGNNFNDSTLSLSASLATIPWRSRQFTGFIIGLNTKDRMYRFAPYRNSKIIKATFNDKKFLIVVKRKNLTWKIESTKGEVGDTNFITVVPGYTALDVAFPDEDDIEALFTSQMGNIGTGERSYFIVDRTKIEQDLVKYEIQAVQSPSAVEGMACENPLVYGYSILDSSGVPVATNTYYKDNLNFIQADSISKLP